MANLSRQFPNMSTAYAGSRRGRFRISSFKALMAIFCIAVLMIVTLWYAEENSLPPVGGLRGGSSTMADHEHSPNLKNVEGGSLSAGEVDEAVGGVPSSIHRIPSTDVPPEGNEEPTREGDQKASSSTPNFEVEGQSGVAGGGGVDQHGSGDSAANGKGSAGGNGGWPLQNMSSQDAGAQGHEREQSDSDDGDRDGDGENADAGVEKESGEVTEAGQNLRDDSPSTLAIEGAGLVTRQQEQQKGEETTAGKEQESIAESDLARDGEVLLAEESSGDDDKEAENSKGDGEQEERTESGNTTASASDDGEPVHEQQGEEEEGDGHGDEGSGTLTVEGSILAEDPEKEEEMEGIGPAASSSLAVDGEALLGEWIEEAGGGKRGNNGHSEEGAEEEEEGDVERRRRELNALVAASVARVEEQKCNIAFVKTHKTASTTLTAVLYRYGLRHGKKVARFDVEGTAVTLDHGAQQTKDRGQRVDIFHYHHVWDGFFKETWDYARDKFGEIMADPDHITYVTAIREPLEHWLSYYYFYYQPENKLDVAEYIAYGGAKRRPLMNPLAAEFGIYTQKDLDDFIERHLPTFALTVRTDELDEGLVLLSRILSWDPIDLTYASMLTNREGATRWDQKPLKKAPKPSDLDKHTISALKEMTKLDAGLYAAAMKHYAKVKKRHSEGLAQAVNEFQMLQEEVLNYLEGPEGEQSPAREWYMPESDYYFYSADKSSWWQRDYPDALPF